jgi:coenzyme F420-reducing hydrogenase beta subunit
MILAWANDPMIQEKGESSGAVTALLKFALKEGALWRQFLESREA